MVTEPVLVFCFVLSACVVFTLSVENEWTHHVVLDTRGFFHMYWSLEDEDRIVFKVECETKGYVALGLSRNGRMTGSDIVTGWVKDGQVFLQDRHSEGNYLPEEDGSQDWELISGKENDTHTTLTFRRKLQTCDQNDLEIDESTMRVIYAYHDEDPSSPKELKYHGSKRGVKSIFLLQPELQSKASVDGLAFWDVQSPNFNITADIQSIYWCHVVKGPDLQEKNHIIRIEPLLKKGNEGYVHHMLLYECTGDDTDNFDALLDGNGHRCYNRNMPDEMWKCDGAIAAWGVGAAPLTFPQHAGLPLSSSPPKYHMLEIHYDNPFLDGNVTDNSGFRLFYTPELREHEAGTFMMGSAVSSRMFIPPGQEKFVVAGHSNPECLAPAMPENGVNLLGIFLHAHLLGRRLIARHFRGSRELKPLAENSNYDFNYQDYLYYSKEIKMLPNDQITVECTYDSTERKTTTFGGLETTDEMCLAFILYYPRIERYSSRSVATLPLIEGLTGMNQDKNDSSFPKDVNYKKTANFMEHYNWEKVNVSVVENALRYSPHDSYCYVGNGSNAIALNTVLYPPKLKPYVKVSICKSGQAVANKRVKPQTNAEQSRFDKGTFSLVMILITLTTIYFDEANHISRFFE